MIRTSIILRSLLVTALCGTACSRSEKPSDAPPTTTKTAPATPEPPAAQETIHKDTQASLDAPVWPDGWLLVSEDEWIPILDDAGNDLAAARKAFLAGDLPRAAGRTRAAAAAIRNEGTRSDVDKARLAQVAKDLDGLATQLDQKKQVTRADLDSQFTNAYRTDVSVSWLHLSEQTLQPTFEQPRVHFERALALLAQHKGADAAAEIRRGSGYFRLAEASAHADDRLLLDKEVSKLDVLAKRADIGTLSGSELQGALAQIDAAYAASYLHQAETQYKANQHAQAGRALTEAAARVRARAQWLGLRTEDAAAAIATELDKVGAELGHGAKLAASKLRALFQRAKSSLGDHAQPDKSPVHHG